MTVPNLHKGTAEILHRVFIDNTRSWPDTASVSAENFLEDIISQGMAPVLWNRVGGRKGTADWPPDVQAGLRDSAMREAAAELRLQVEITALLDAFAGAGLKPLLLKGTPLSYTLYPAPGMRPRCDTDILIPESAREQTAETMKRLGYDALYEASVDFINSQMCYSGKGKSGINHSYDIHWLVSNNDRRFSRFFDYERLGTGSINIPELGENCRAPNRVDALILACFHRAGHFSHSGDRLIWLYDIHLLGEVLSKEEASTFCNIARELKMVRLCSDAISTARSWFGSHLSPTLESLLQENPGTESSSVHLQPGKQEGIRNKTVRDLQGMASWRERLLYLIQNAFPPTKYMLWRYNTKQKAALPWLYLKRLAHSARIFLVK